MKAKALVVGLLVLFGGLTPSGTAQDGVTASVPDDPSDLYQNDGASGEDASDECTGARPELTLGERGFGEMLPLEDPVDHFLVPIESVPTDGDASLDVHVPKPLHPLPLSERSEPSWNGTVIVFSPGGCNEVLASEPLHSGETTTVGFAVDSPGDYVARLVLEEIKLGTLALPGATPQGYHCSPACPFSFDLTAAT